MFFVLYTLLKCFLITFNICMPLDKEEKISVPLEKDKRERQGTMMENLKPIFHLGLLPYLSDSIYGMPTACYFNADALSQMLNRNITKQMLFLFFYYFILFIYFWLLWFFVAVHGFLQLRQVGTTLRCGVRASHCGSFSCCGAWALGTRASVVVAHGLQSAGSVVVAHGLSCSAACGIFLDQGSNPCPLHWQADS